MTYCNVRSIAPWGYRFYVSEKGGYTPGGGGYTQDIFSINVIFDQKHSKTQLWKDRRHTVPFLVRDKNVLYTAVDGGG